MSERSPFIVGIGGTTRPGSSSEQALTIALRHAEERGAKTLMIAGRELVLPLYEPESAERAEGAQHLSGNLRRADGIIVASPCYHGAISGLIKNALDYVEDMRGDERPYFDGRAVGCIGCGAGSQGPSMVLVELRSIVHALRGWPTPLGVAVNTQVVKFREGGCSDPAIESQLKIMAEQVVAFAQVRLPKS